MRNIALAALLLATIAFGGLYYQQTRKTKQAQVSAETLQQRAETLQANLEEQNQRASRLQEQLEESRKDKAAISQEAAQLRATLKQSATNQTSALSTLALDHTATNSKSSNPFSELFKNPEMKEMIKNQQKTALGGIVDKNYKKLFADLHLSPEQKTTLKDLILNKQLGAAELGISMLTGENDEAKRAELVQKIKDASDASDAQIKEFLGEDNFAQFQSYEKTLGERMSVSGFKDQLSSGATALNDSQEEQLIQAMTQERQNFKFTTDLSDKSKFNGDFASMFTEDKMNTFFQEMGQLNERYTTRAQSILSPDQYAAFQKYLKDQQALQKAGMQMASKMFAPAKASGGN